LLATLLSKSRGRRGGRGGLRVRQRDRERKTMEPLSVYVTVDDCVDVVHCHKGWTLEQFYAWGQKHHGVGAPDTSHLDHYVDCNV
jgi:hypothetical protein